MYSGQNSSSIYTPTESSSGGNNFNIGGNPNLALVLGQTGGIAGWIGPALVAAVAIAGVLFISKARKR